jgi:hypothetical protein
MNASSISPAANGNGLPPPPNDALSVIIHPEVDIDILAEAKTSPPQPVPMYDEAGNIIIGSADGRNNIIKQGLISPQDATLLVDQWVLFAVHVYVTTLMQIASTRTWHPSYLATCSSLTDSRIYRMDRHQSHPSFLVSCPSCLANVSRHSIDTKLLSRITSRCSYTLRRPSRGKT